MFCFFGATASRVWSVLVLGSFVLVCGSSTQALPLLISEVFYDAESSADGYVFVELVGDPGTLLDGLVREGGNGFDGEAAISLVLEGEVPASSLLVVADTRRLGVSFVEHAALLAEFDFQNGPDSVVLR